MNSKIFFYCADFSAQHKQSDLKVAVQPNMSCEGWPADAGSMALKNFTALEDATVIRLLKQAGAKMVGSTHMSELGFGLVGNTATQTITENVADVALITDNMGESRVGASRVGITGYKPSYGIVSRKGLIGIIPSMECFGILADDIKKIRSAIKIICVKDDQDFSMIHDTLPEFYDTPSFKEVMGIVGIQEDYEKHLTKAEKAAWQTAVKKLEKAGFQIKTVKITDTSVLSAVHNVIGAVEASSSAGKYDGVRYGHRTDKAQNWNEMYLKSRGESFGTLVKTYLFQGAYFQFENYAAFENACRIRGHILDETRDVFSGADWMACLTIREKHDASKSFNIKDTYQAFSFNVLANLSGLPAIQLPGLAISENMDFGLQITGPFLKDPELLEVAEYLKQKTDGGSV